MKRWNEVLAALGVEGTGETPMTVAGSKANEERFIPGRWNRVTRTLEALAQCAGGSDPPADPEVGITAGAGISEGNDASFTVTATPPPSAALDVSVTISQSGDFAATGSRTVTIPTSGSQTFTVATVDDNNVEPNGSVTATVESGSGYTVSSSAGSATVAVVDDDNNNVTAVEVSFGDGSFAVVERDDLSTPGVREDRVQVSVVLDADPGRTVVVPVKVVHQGGATAGDYSGVPASVTFNSGETAKSFTFAAVADSVDDAGEVGESVLLGFGALPAGVSEGSPAETVVHIGARRLFQAHEFDAKSGSVAVNDVAPDYSSVGGIGAGDWLRFDDVRLAGSPDVLMVSLAAGSGDVGDTIEVRLDSVSGTRVAELTIASTGGVTVFSEQYASVSGASGTHDVFLVFPKATQANINWFVFSMEPDVNSKTEPGFADRMQWWRDARFGQFIHWGAYSHLAGTYRGQNRTNQVAEWIMYARSISIDDYEKDAAVPFNPTAFDADGWAQSAKDAGQKYVVITSKHHDGFSLFDTHVRGFETKNSAIGPARDYDIADISGFGRDPIAELADAYRAQGIAFGLYYSIWDWHYWFEDSIANDTRHVNDYLSAMKEQLREIIEKYDPALLWFDGEWTTPWTRPMGEALYKYLRVLKPDLVINDRVTKREFFAHDDGDYDSTAERRGPDHPVIDWEMAQTMNETWGFNEQDTDWKPVSQYLEELVSVTSRDGNYLLNIGPDGTGTVPAQSVSDLKAVGDWLATHGEAVYATDKPNPLSDSTPSWGWYTQKGDTVYAVVKDWPAGGRLELENLDATVTKATILGSPDTSYEIRRRRGRLAVAGLPATAPNPYLSVIALSTTGTARNSRNDANLALNRPVTVSSVWYSQAKYKGANAVDGTDATHWFAGRRARTAQLDIDLDDPQTFNQIIIREAPNKQRVDGFRLQRNDNRTWVTFHTGTTIGTNLVIDLAPVTTDKVRFDVTSTTTDAPRFLEFEIRNLPQSLAYNNTASASSSKSSHGAANAFDADTGTHWEAADSDTTATLTVELGAQKTFNEIIVKEPAQTSLQRVTGFELQRNNNGSWATFHTGTTIGTGKVITFSPLTTDKVRLAVTSTTGNGPAIAELEIWNDQLVTADLSAPAVSIAAGSPITEGGDATFTITATPPPSAGLDVSVTVSQTGDYGATTGAQTVTVPTTGSYILTVATSDDSLDEADGSVTATVDSGTGYTVSSSAGAATVDVADDDPPVTSEGHAAAIVNGSVTIEPPDSWTGRGKPQLTGGAHRLDGWTGIALSVSGLGAPPQALTVSWASRPQGDVSLPLEWQQVAGSRWQQSDGGPIGLTTVKITDPPTASTPEVSVTAGGGVTEGGDATFTITATPPPSDGLDVSVTVSQTGDWGAATGAQTLTIPTTGSVAFTVATSDDSLDEADGSVTATIGNGSGYTVSSTAGSATVVVSDDDVPELSISAAGGVTEGDDATFTITASPTPYADLPVTITTTQSGNFGASIGSRTVTIPTSGRFTYTVATDNDSTDEANGSITVTVNDGTGYTVSSTAGSTTVAVSDDDDDPPLTPPPSVPVISIAAGPAVTEGAAASFTVSASPVPAAPLTVNVEITQSGAWGATTGPRTVTVPTTGSFTFTVTTTNDGIDEPDGSITAVIRTGVGYTASNTAATAAVAVSDDDEPPPPCTAAVTVSDATAAEGDSAGLRFAVEIAPACDQAATMGFGIWDATAARDQDYDYPYEIVTLEPGQTSHVIVVTVIDDNTPEGDETLTVFVYFPTGITTPRYFTYATGTITDND